MKRAKLYIVTYKRSDILNNTLKNIFDSDFANVNNAEVNIINNHSEFYLEDRFKDKVKVLHNELRPDWSNGNLGENWNQALINGFKNLENPDTKYLITMQNDTVVHPEWFSNLMNMHKKFNFIVGQFGDNLVSYTPEAVKKIGIWDENFGGIQYKEADYWIRALIFNKDKSCINDTLHGLELNNSNALKLDITEGRNYIEENGFRGDKTLKRKADDSEHKQIWSTRGGIYKDCAWRYFTHKWKGTWAKDPEKLGWVKKWAPEFVNNPPNMSKSKVTHYMKYIYFEKDIEGLKEKRYLV